MAALQSIPNPDQYNPELPSPFDSLPPHLIANIFAQITQVGSKIRLSRVCDRFRTCVQLEQSWQFNTALKSQELKSPQSVLAFIKHVPRVQSLDLHLPDKSGSGWMPPEVLQHAEKFRFTRLHVSSDVKGDAGVLLFLDKCVQYFGPTLTHLRIDRLYRRRAMTVLTNLMAKCSALEDVYILWTPIGTEPVISCLEGKPLKKLEIHCARPFDGRLLTSLINSVPGHTLHTIRTPYRSARPIEFCRQLESSAAGALKNISLVLGTAQDDAFFEFVRHVPRLLPNVEEVSIICYLRDIPSSCFACTKAFKHLLDSAQHRPHPISIEFNPQSRGMTAGWFNAISCDFDSSSGYSVQIHTGSPWKRTISKGQASVTLVC